MSNCKLSLVVLSVLCFALPASAQKIATANAAKVFNEMQEKKDLTAKMENERKTIEAQDLEKKQHLKDLQAARDAIKSDAPGYEKVNQDLFQAAIEYQTWAQITQANVQRNQKLQMVNLFNKITAAIAEVATQKGIDLVIAEQRPELPDNLDQFNVEQVRALINSRNILYSTATVDISNDVINAMDAKYKAGK
jgi:Skp family chaperone for outer membrane proteins